MPEFLSPAWIDALDRAARETTGLAAVAAPAPLVVEQRVRRPAGDEVVYYLTFGTGGARVVAGAAPEPDLVLVTDLETAWALAQGATNAQQAVAAGRLTLRGRAERLRAAGEGLRALGDVFAAVRAATTEPSGGVDPHR